MKQGKGISFKSQSAMEYLMTYGWAILIIAVVLGALFQLGVFNSSSFSPRAPPGACQVFRPSGPRTTTNINLMGVCTGQLPQYVAQFNGASSYVTYDIPPAMNVASGSVSAWFYVLSHAGGSGTIFSIGNGYEAKSLILTVTSASIYITHGNDTSFRVVSWGTTINARTWYYLTYTWNSSTFNIYFNGALKAPVTASLPTSWKAATPIKIGVRQSLLTFFNGSIANAQIYNTSLSANQIQALYLEGIGGAPMKLQNLMGWWPLNGNANDYSGNNNNGVPSTVTFTSQYGK